TAPTRSRPGQTEGASRVRATGASAAAPANARVSAGSAANRPASSARQRTGSTTRPRSAETASAPSPARARRAAAKRAVPGAPYQVPDVTGELRRRVAALGLAEALVRAGFAPPATPSL